MNADHDNPVRRVLVIDDNEAIHADIRKILSPDSQVESELAAIEQNLFDLGGAPRNQMQFDVESARQGAEGVDMIRAAETNGRPFEMAFVDVRMPPGIDGIETVARIWSDTPDVQIVICSAFSDYNFDDIVARFGWKDNLLVLKKPVEAIEVRQVACALTEKWRMSRRAQMRMADLESAVRARTRELENHKGELEATIRRLEQTQALLLHAQKLEAIGQLAAGIAHEINTPIQYVGDNVNFLRESFSTILQQLQKLEEAPTTEQRETAVPSTTTNVPESGIEEDLQFLLNEIPAAFEQTLQGIRRVTEIVQSMRQFAHPGVDGQTMIDLNEAIQSTITVCRNEWRYVADLELKLEPNLPHVPCYAGEFNQVILNLVVNAAQALGEVVTKAAGKGRILVSTRLDGDYVEVRVSDNGPGMTEDVRRKVFDPFFTTKEVGKGTGQGLAIAHSVIVEKHRGQITVESAPGKGATFSVRLPLVAEESERSAP